MCQQHLFGDFPSDYHEPASLFGLQLDRQRLPLRFVQVRLTCLLLRSPQLRFFQ